MQAFWGSFVGTINTEEKPELLPINMDTAKKDDSLAFVYKLTSKKSMTDFVAAVYASGILDIKEEYNGNPSLNTLGREVFTEDFFKNNSVLMVHQSWLNEKSEFGLKEIIIKENKLTAVIEFTNEETKSTIDDIMNISKTGQLILIEIPNEKLEEIEIFDTELYKE